MRNGTLATAVSRWQDRVREDTPVATVGHSCAFPFVPIATEWQRLPDASFLDHAARPAAECLS